MKLPVLLASVSAIAALTTASANAATLSYSLSGGGITGTFNGAAFTATGFNITAIADTSTIVFGDLFDNGPAYLIPVSPTIEIFTLGGGSLTATLQPNPGKTLMAAGVAFAGTPSSVAHGFIIFDSFASPIIGGLGSASAGTTSSNLASPATINGQLTESTSFLSSAGTIVLTIPAETDSTFTISAVPEPASAAASLLSALSGMLLVSRRQRR